MLGDVYKRQAKRFGRRADAPFGGGVHWTGLAGIPYGPSQRQFDEGAFDATAAPAPADLADAFFWVEAFSGEHSDPYSCLALDAVPCDGRVVRDPDGILDDRAVGPELVLTGFLKDAFRAWHMANVPSVRIMGALRSRVVVLYAWERPRHHSFKREGCWPESWDAEDWDEAVTAYSMEVSQPGSWLNSDPDRVISLHATYGMDVPSPHAADALFSIRGDYLVPEGAQTPSRSQRGRGSGSYPPASDLLIRLKVPMQVWGHVSAWRD